MKIENMKLNPETLVFESGFIVDTFTTSFNQDIKDGHARAVKEAKKNGTDEPDKPEGMDVPAVLKVDLTGASLAEVLEYVHKPRRISHQNSLKQAFGTAELFDAGVRDKTFTIPAIPERAGVDDFTKASRSASKLTKEEAAELAKQLAEQFGL